MSLPLEHAPAGAVGDGPEPSLHPKGATGRLAAQRKALEAQGARDFEHPGFDGMKVTYRRLRIEDTNRILYGNSEEPVLQRNLQLLVEASTRIVCSDEDGVFLTTAGYDRALADAMEFEIDPAAGMGEARQIVLATFGGHEQPVLTHAAAVYTWMQVLERETREKLLGEASGTRP